ncbi:hypothetical protein GCK32_003587 [Trichostrongylus colubriformis]|uniref:Uncharacterized protein n=1 Tax=Trichostrongylus colubriformis TaxID=6319 RepID=A0AAN8FH87_TRICO
MGALIAGRIFSMHGTTVIAATTINTAVAQFTETLLKLDEFKNLDILRYVSDSALTEGRTSTTVDMPTILKGLIDNYGQLLDDELAEMCRTYKHGRQLLETYLIEPERTVFLSEANREE